MISVVLATFNGELYLKQQLDSILSQLSHEDELIISDDHSTDKTISIINTYQDPRIHLLINDPKNHGYSGNFENALTHTKGSIIFMSDQDDVWFAHKVEKMSQALAICDIAISDATVTGAALEPLYLSHFKHAHVKKGLMINFAKTRYIGACMAFNRLLLEKALPFPSQKKHCPHDYWITLIGEAFFKVQLIDEPLIYYRRHSQNASSGGITTSSDSLWLKIYRRLYCGAHLIFRSMRP
jgi:glycosyltransferase involved in cell wall biosynthesis